MSNNRVVKIKGEDRQGVFIPAIAWGDLGDLTKEEKETIAYAFPTHVSPGIKPVAANVLVMYPRPKKKQGSIIMSHLSQDIEEANTCKAMVVALGPLAFRYKQPTRLSDGSVARDANGKAIFEEWAEGAYVQPGQFVRVPRFGADRWKFDDPLDKESPVGFGIYNDKDIIGVIYSNPLDIKSFWGVL